MCLSFGKLLEQAQYGLQIGDHLEVLSPAEVGRFAKDLRESLYHLDRREFGQIRVRTATGMEFPQTSDHFLYARCACVMAGAEVYESVLKTGSGFEWFVSVFAQGAESLLYLAPEIYKNKVGEGLQIAGSFPIESMSNAEGWDGSGIAKITHALRLACSLKFIAGTRGDVGKGGIVRTILQEMYDFPPELSMGDSGGLALSRRHFRSGCFGSRILQVLTIMETGIRRRRWCTLRLIQSMSPGETRHRAESADKILGSERDDIDDNPC